MNLTKKNVHNFDQFSNVFVSSQVCERGKNWFNFSTVVICNIFSCFGASLVLWKILDYYECKDNSYDMKCNRLTLKAPSSTSLHTGWNLMASKDEVIVTVYGPSCDRPASKVTKCRPSNTSYIHSDLILDPDSHISHWFKLERYIS